MAKMILMGKEAREKIVQGTNIIADAVVSTLGPKGSNVGIGKFWVDPVVLHDGVSVAKEISLEDKFEDFAAQLIRQAAAKTNDRSGDGTTSTTLLAQEMINYGMSLVDKEINPMSIKKGMEMAKKDIIEQIKLATIPVETEEKIRQVANISSQSSEIGKIIAEAIWKVGKSGSIDVEESSKYTIDYEIKEGMEFEKGITSPQFVNTDKNTVELEKCLILLIDHPIASAEKLIGFLTKVLELKKEPFSILIMADNIDPNSLESLLTNKKNGSLFSVFIQSPGFAERRKEYLQDIAILTGARVVSGELGMNLDNITPDVLGYAEKVAATDKNTKIIGGRSTKTEINNRIKQIEAKIEDADSEFEKKIHKERVAKLTAGCGVIKVGGLTEVEMKDNKERVIDAVEATKTAFSDGIVYGGGRLLVEISDYLTKNKKSVNLNKQEMLGYDLVARALQQPFRRLMNNSGIEVSDETFKKGFGYNAQNGKKVDLIKAGIIDPAQVVVNTIQNAISVAAMLITCNTIIVDKEDPATRQAGLNI